MESFNSLSFYRDFFNYNHQINLKLAASFEKLTSQLNPKIIELSCHIVNAHSIWNSRLNGTQDPCKPWDIFPIHEFRLKDQKNFESTIEMVNRLDLEKLFSYQNSKGNSFENRGTDILTHIVNHSTYHRGQIAMLMRESGLEPVPSDFIHFKIQ